VVCGAMRLLEGGRALDRRVRMVGSMAEIRWWYARDCCNHAAFGCLDTFLVQARHALALARAWTTWSLLSFWPAWKCGSWVFASEGRTRLYCIGSNLAYPRLITARSSRAILCWERERMTWELLGMSGEGWSG